MRLLLALHRIGPYHHSRFAALAAQDDLHVLETRPYSTEYPWQGEATGPYALYRLSEHLHPEADPPSASLRRQLDALLTSIQPQVIVTVGWADRAYQQLMVLAHSPGVPLVLVSDSRRRDSSRRPAKEWLKRQLLRGYSAALVAGTESRAYLQGLGFPPAAIYQPWDVVDNAFFAAAASACASGQPHFLCVSRLVAKKNHHGLLEAYAAYQRQGGRWGLVLVGSGPCQQAFEAKIAILPDPARVQLLPFCQLQELRRMYGQANAFVLASTTDQWGLVVNEAMAAGLPCLVSTACGCAVDLIEHGVSGWCFDPGSPEQLTSGLHTAEQQPLPERQVMVAAARRRLDDFTPQRFALGLQQAAAQAVEAPRHSRRAAAVARLLSMRS